MTHCSTAIAQIREAQKLRPNFSELARELGVSPQHVRRVFLGTGTSQRVMKAIEKKIRQQQRKVGNGERAA